MSFTPDELKKHITEMLNVKSVVPDGHRGVFGIYIDDSGARLVTAYKGSNGWEAVGSVNYHPHEDNLKVGFNILKTW